MKQIKLINIICVIITSFSINTFAHGATDDALPGDSSISSSSSSSSIPAVEERRFQCFPSQLADAGYNIYVTQYPTLNVIRARLVEISFMGERPLPKIYELKKIIVSNHLVLQSDDFDIEFFDLELPEVSHKLYPAIMKLRGELLRSSFKEIKLNCLVSP